MSDSSINCWFFLAIVRPIEYNKAYVRCENMGYMTASHAAEKWNVSQRRVQILCAQNRIEGVFKLGENWAIPDEAEKPKDYRKRGTTRK